MENSILLSAAMGGLVGSLITIVISKVVGIALMGKQHRMSLQSAYFERKLRAAENALSQWHAATALLSGIVGLYERITTRERELEYALYRETNEALIGQWTTVSQAAHDVANTVLLYFDTASDSFINADLVRKLLERLSSIRSLDVSLKFALDMYDRFKGSRKEEAAWNEVKIVMQDYRTNLKDMAAIVGQVQTEMTGFLTSIGKEVRKYEPR